MQTPLSTAENTPFDDGDLYDMLFERFDFGVEFYLDLARRARGPILDVACGTGRVMLPCLTAGLEVEGLDLFGSMLARLRKKASALGFQPRLHETAMSSFRLDRRFALIMIPFNSFVHNLTADDQISALKCCHQHLEPGGLLAFDTYFPNAALLTGPENVRDLELEATHPETGLPVRLYDTRSFNRVEQLQHSKMEVELLDAAGKVVNVRKSQTTVRWIYKSEMELLLRLAGFDRWQISGGFDRRPVVNDTDGTIVEARTK